jgi:uncharacterized BrkB/YihY/UPF0761 family membrane protein
MTKVTPPPKWQYLLMVLYTLVVLAAWFFLTSGFVYITLALGHVMDSHQTRAFWDICIDLGATIGIVVAFLVAMAIGVFLYVDCERWWKAINRRMQQSLR